jgi:hypothetical protein
MPGDNDKSADPKDRAPDRKDGDADRPEPKWYKWPKRIWAVLGVVAVIGGVVAFGGEVGHWFTELSPASGSTCGMSTAGQVEQSPRLGISFHQNNQVALMTYENSDEDQIPLIDVCLSSAPFEIWFPALGSTSALEICTYSSLADFRQDPFYVDQSTAAAGCLYPPTGFADYPYGSGALFESIPQDPGHAEIVGSRTELASGGDEKYLVSTVYYRSPVLSLEPVPMSRQSASLYLVVYLPNNYPPPGPDAHLEHFVLRFK